ncbi:hypothetical protein B0H19DRAFT_1082138 [Mycena capillaripes]|nr:hypothetical protein B0H19DRAFT_1082138 [Mycena capillaripes]
MTTSSGYEIIENEDGDEKHSRRPQYRVSSGTLALIAIICVQSMALVTMTIVFHQKGGTNSHPRIYSSAKIFQAPAQAVAEEIIRVYPIGFGNEISEFQGPPSPPVDRAWDDLYQHVAVDGISRIPKSEAVLLPNRTSPIPGDPGFYIAELDVFHQLHCLNTIRKALHPSYYPDWDISKGGYPQDHISHCIEWIRHSIMCHSDTSVVVNFDSIQEWSRKNSLTGEMDLTVHLPDELPALRSL